MACFPNPSLFDAPFELNPLEFQDETYPTKAEGCGYRTVKFDNPTFRLIHQYDGQTDGRAIAYFLLLSNL